MSSIDDYLDQASSASSTGVPSAGSGQKQEPQVFWGVDKSKAHMSRVVASKPDWNSYLNGKGPLDLGGKKVIDGTAGLPSTKSLSDAKMEFYRWSDADRAKWGDYLAGLGLIDPADKRDFSSLNKAWSDIVDEAANFTSAGKKLDPWQVASLIAGGTTANGAGGKAAGFSGTKSQTSKSVDLTDPATAKALVNDVLAKQLGRAATPEELDTFKGVLNAAERNSPTTTTSSTTYNNGDAVSQSSTSAGGLGAAGKQQVLTDAAMQKPEFGAYQAATTYMEALRQAIGSPV